jgi:hypothetical protein
MCWHLHGQSSAVAADQKVSSFPNNPFTVAPSIKTSTTGSLTTPLMESVIRLIAGYRLCSVLLSIWSMLRLTGHDSQGLGPALNESFELLVSPVRKLVRLADLVAVDEQALLFAK